MTGRDSSIPIERIEKHIYSIRGQSVMLDRDLAELYDVETRVLNQAVRRNIGRFPADFTFVLTRDEIMRMSQSVTSSTLRFSKQVHAFTEQGVAMLSSVLNSPCAIDVNIAIMRVFVRIRRLLASHAELALRLKEHDDRLDEHDGQIAVIFQAIEELTAPAVPPQRKIGFQVKESRAAYRPRRRRKPQ